MSVSPVTIALRGAKPRVDGRRLRSERTRQNIIESYLGLPRRNPQIPTAAQIAKEAGVAVRSVFERFSDLPALTLATADYAIAEGQAAAAARDVDGDRPTRIRSHVRTRAAACERWWPLWRVMVAAQQEVKELHLRIVMARQANVARMRLMYGPELAALAEPQREQLLIAMATMISFESWDQMRDCYGLSPDDAQAVWRAAIDRMLRPRRPPQPRQGDKCLLRAAQGPNCFSSSGAGWQKAQTGVRELGYMDADSRSGGAHHAGRYGPAIVRSGGRFSPRCGQYPRQLRARRPWGEGGLFFFYTSSSSTRLGASPCARGNRAAAN